MDEPNIPHDRSAIPDAFDVSVVLELPPHGGVGGEVIGVVVADAVQGGTIRRDAKGEQIVRPGFRVRLHEDEAESYYMNLTAERPSIFVICRQDEGGRFEPALVTLSYDEASSYMEVEDAVFSVPLPPELYRWMESFVLEHYVPEPKKKRRLENWKHKDSG